MEQARVSENGEQAIEVIVRAGSMLMRAGAEVYRVEDTMQILGNSIPGVSSCVPYVTTTGVMCSLVYEGVTYTRIARIKSQSRNIAIINEINHLSRQSQKEHFTAAQLEQKLAIIKDTPVYSEWVKALLGGVGAAGFAIFFGGSPADVVAVMLIGLLVRFGTTWLSHIRINDFISTTFLSILAGTFSVLIAHYFPQTSQGTLIISSIMLLVPGLAIMNAIRDIMMGEYLSGSASLVQALFVAAAIAIGIAFSLFVAQYLTMI